MSEQRRKVIKDELGVFGTRRCFGVELSREPRAEFVSYALICSVVEIDKQRLPFGGQSLVIHRKAMILAGDITALGAYKAYRLRCPYLSLNTEAPAALASN